MFKGYLSFNLYVESSGQFGLQRVHGMCICDLELVPL